MALVEHSFRLDLAAGGQTAQMLRQAAQVLHQVPAFGLHYRRDYATSAALLDTLLGHAADLSTAARESR